MGTRVKIMDINNNPSKYWRTLTKSTGMPYDDIVNHNSTVVHVDQADLNSLLNNGMQVGTNLTIADEGQQEPQLVNTVQRRVISIDNPNGLIVLQ